MIRAEKKSQKFCNLSPHYMKKTNFEANLNDLAKNLKNN